MLAQAEHDTDASAILLTTSRSLAEGVASEIARQLETLSTAAVAKVAIKKNSAIILVRDLEEAAELSNRFAPEHLALHHEELIPAIRHAGSIFLGSYSPEAAGDYASGPNHVLPTSGVARLRGGLSAAGSSYCCLAVLGIFYSLRRRRMPNDNDLIGTLNIRHPVELAEVTLKLR
jgi:histidinol dehydrogenase